MPSFELLTDLELANLLKSGDHAVFTEIYNRYWKFLFNSAYSALRDKESSMDVCQTVFLWLWENREVITVKNSLKAYLHINAPMSTKSLFVLKKETCLRTLL